MAAARGMAPARPGHVPEPAGRGRRHLRGRSGARPRGRDQDGRRKAPHPPSPRRGRLHLVALLRSRTQRGSHPRPRWTTAHPCGGAPASGTRRLRPDRRRLWEREPSQEAVEMLGHFTDLATTMERVVADGWTPLHGHVSTRQELDDYEWAWTGSLARWALIHRADPDSPMHSRRPRPTALDGCASTAAPGASSALSCARQPTDHGRPVPPGRPCASRRSPMAGSTRGRLPVSRSATVPTAD